MLATMRRGIECHQELRLLRSPVVSLSNGVSSSGYDFSVSKCDLSKVSWGNGSVSRPMGLSSDWSCEGSSSEVMPIPIELMLFDRDCVGEAEGDTRAVMMLREFIATRRSNPWSLAEVRWERCGVLKL